MATDVRDLDEYEPVPDLERKRSIYSMKHLKHHSMNKRKSKKLVKDPVLKEKRD